ELALATLSGGTLPCFQEGCLTSRRHYCAASLFGYRRVGMYSLKLLLHLIASMHVVSICMASGKFVCPIDLSPPKYSGYITSDNKCVSFIPKNEIPDCGRHLHECLQQFCATEFPVGRLMHWDPKDISSIRDPKMIKWKEAIKILNGRILLNRVTFTSRRQGQRGAWTTFDCMNFETFCGEICLPVEYCSWFTNGWFWHFGRWHDYYITSEFLKDLTSQGYQQHLSTIRLPACRNVILYKSGEKTPKIDGLYICTDKDFDYFACQHNKSAACEMKAEKKCHYSPQHKECRLWKYKIIAPPSKYGIPCEKRSEEKCTCPCTGEPQEWQPWSATCGVMRRSRMKPKDRTQVDCKQSPDRCCKEEETKVGEDCKSYAFNTSINLREKTCKNGIKGVDASGHLDCVCDAGYTGVLCDTAINNCASNPCRNGARCQSVKRVFVCHCKPGWTGNLCDKRREDCKEGTCLHGGTCVRSGGASYCKCPEGYGGTACEYPVRWCDEDTCHGRGDCANITHLRSFKCHCYNNFTGTRCEEIAQLPQGEVVVVEIDPGLRVWLIVVVLLIVLLVLLFIGATYTAREKRRRRRGHLSSSYGSYRTSRESQSSIS
ncbi:hypothetical protein M514_04334, partial [Trichuris suis]